MAVARSTDLRGWRPVFSGVSAQNPLFDDLIADSLAFEYVGRHDEGGYSVWAPDVIYNRRMEKYVMYFSITSSYVRSSIAWATADRVDGPYSYQDRLIYSGFTHEEIERTNVLDLVDRADTFDYASSTSYQIHQWPNAIEPALFYDAEDRLWMVYGSWSGGIFILEIDEATGRPIHPEPDRASRTDPCFGTHLLGGNHRSIEGPCIVYAAESGYYFPFVSDGRLVVVPFAYLGDVLSVEKLTPREAAGAYHLVSSGADISDVVATPVRIDLRSDGGIAASDRRQRMPWLRAEGGSADAWILTDGPSNMAITLGGTEYRGLFISQQEEAGNGVLTFTAASSRNDSICGVRY